MYIQSQIGWLQSAKLRLLLNKEIRTQQQILNQILGLGNIEANSTGDLESDLTIRVGKDNEDTCQIISEVILISLIKIVKTRSHLTNLVPAAPEVVLSTVQLFL